MSDGEPDWAEVTYRMHVRMCAVGFPSTRLEL